MSKKKGNIGVEAVEARKLLHDDLVVALDAVEVPGSKPGSKLHLKKLREVAKEHLDSNAGPNYLPLDLNRLTPRKALDQNVPSRGLCRRLLRLQRVCGVACVTCVTSPPPCCYCCDDKILCVRDSPWRKEHMSRHTRRRHISLPYQQQFHQSVGTKD